MASDTHKNHLAAARKYLGLNQRDLAGLLGLKSPARICAMEMGRTLPTARDCIVFLLAFKRSLEELWPDVYLETETGTDANSRRLIGRLRRQRVRSHHKQARAADLAKSLTILVDGFEDLTDVI